MSTKPEDKESTGLIKFRAVHRDRTLWKIDFPTATPVVDEYGITNEVRVDVDYEMLDREEVGSWSEANAVSSLCRDGQHMPAIDIDRYCEVVPSSTFGHFHLYINVKMSWWRYRVLLWALKYSGVIEPGFYRASRRRGQTMLRLPGVKK